MFLNIFNKLLFIGVGFVPYDKLYRLFKKEAPDKK